jgi:hypothetical protein
MQTTFTFEDSSLLPTAGELDDGSSDFINPGLYAKALSDRIQQGLQARGWRTKGQLVEDWGRWIEIEHGRGYFLAVGAASMINPDKQESAEHRAFVEPSKPRIRRWFRSINTEPDVIRLTSALRDLLQSDPNITNLREGE